MAEIELHINEQEESSFKERESPKWPFIPSPCTVAECEIFGVFSSFRDFREHWTKKHTPETSFYKCQKCHKSFSDSRHAKSHTKSRIHKGQSITTKYMRETNDRYIDPKDNLPYQLGDKQDRTNMLSLQRQRARDQRKQEMAEKENDFSKIPYFGDGICRDERVVERNGHLYRDTNLWSKTMRKRTKLTPVEEN